MSELKPQLSEYERGRREEILSLALRAASRRRWRRRSFNVVVVIFVATSVAIWAHRESSTPLVPIVLVPTSQPKAGPSDMNQIIVERIADDPDVVARLTIPPSPSTVRRIGDEQLLKELAAADEPAGLAYVNGKAELIYR